jgi:regulator of protease activity HflC (stomatin/prohibitin superfamily)
MRFTILSDEGERLGSVFVEEGRVETDDLLAEGVAQRIQERYRELRQAGGYEDAERLVRATLERVSADTGVRFVREPED